MIPRTNHLRRIEARLRAFKVVGIIGARQVGKTTLAREIARKHGATYFDLERPSDLARLADPSVALEPLRGLVVLDEIQRRPDLFPAIRAIVDRPRGPRFLVLGSASPELLQQTSESLAGRIAYHELPPLALSEVGMGRRDRLWLRGGFPSSFTARSERESFEWRESFIQTFVERDAPQLGLGMPAMSLRRLWAMLAHVHGQVLNASDLARSMGVSDVTIRRWIDALAATFMVRLLSPWHENLAKRQVKMPKLYLADSGLLHAFLDVHTFSDLERHPRVGASWEGFCIEAIIDRLEVPRSHCHFWATHQGAELDLLVIRGRHRHGFEVKLTAAPSVTPSMRIALEDLRLDGLDVVHAGNDTFPLAPRIRAVALRRLSQDIRPLR